MRHILIVTGLAVLVFTAIGCATEKPSLQELYPNLIDEAPPERIPYVEKEIYIDSIGVINVQSQKAIIVKGTLPNPCTSILRVDELTVPEMITLNLIGWQRYQESCIQTIEPFTYIHQGISREQWKEIKIIKVNEKEFRLNSDSQN